MVGDYKTSSLEQNVSCFILVQISRGLSEAN